MPVSLSISAYEALLCSKAATAAQVLVGSSVRLVFLAGGFSPLVFCGFRGMVGGE
jgi:hypothetical protein